MFFEIWKKINKKRLNKLNKIAPYIEPTEQSKKISKKIYKGIKLNKAKIYVNGKEIK